MRTTFKAYERLKREQHINTLFLTGRAFSVFPVRRMYLMVPRPDVKASPVQIGFSVPKKKIRSSVDRHRVKRQMWEAWRLNKIMLYNIVPADKQLHVFLMFTDRQLPVYDTVHVALLKAIDKLGALIIPSV